MGLDTTHDCWHGAYSAFGRWRELIAKAGGYHIAKSAEGIPYTALDWDSLPPGYLEGEWPETPHDALLVLLAHSDCDGVIHPAQAGPLADRLERLLPKLDGDAGGHIGNVRDKTVKFINGLRTAASAGEDVEFQ